MQRALGFVGLAAAALAVACAPVESGSTPSVPNPTGTCTAPDDGSRPGYSAGQSGAAWLVDCQNPLAREYWRVFAESTESAYVMPRPDAAPELRGVCANPEHELYALAQHYLLCAPAATPEAVDRINSMLPADALQITHYLHSVLAFVVEAGGVGIAPYPLPGDILDACALHPDQNSTALVAICDAERARLESGQDIGLTYTGVGAVELVARINELYGVICEAGLIPVEVCSCGPTDGCADVVRVCRSACQTDTDCSAGAYPTCTSGFCNQLCG